MSHKPSGEVHAQLAGGLVSKRQMQSQVKWCLGSFLVAVITVVLDKFVSAGLGAQTAWLLQVCSLVFFILMLGASLVAPSSTWDQNSNSPSVVGLAMRGGTKYDTPRYDIMGRGSSTPSASSTSLRSGGGRSVSSDSSPRIYYDARGNGSSSSSSSGSGSGSINRINGANRGGLYGRTTTPVAGVDAGRSGAASYGSSSSVYRPSSSSSSPRGSVMSTPATTPGSVSNTQYATPGSGTPAGMPTPTALSPSVNVRVSSGRSSGVKRATPERSHMFDSNFSSSSKKASRGSGYRGYTPGSGSRGAGISAADGGWRGASSSSSSSSMSNITSPAAYYSQQPYHESPASEARMSHMLDNGLMLMTKNAFHALEGHDESRKISYGEMDSWVEGLRKVLYDHVRSELGILDAAIPAIIKKVRGANIGIARQADLDGLTHLLRGLSTYTLLGSPTKEMSYSEVLSILEKTFENDNEFRHILNKYKHSAVIFVPLRSSDRRAAAGGAMGRSYEGGGGGNSAPIKPSPSLAQALRSIVSHRRLPTDTSSRRDGESGAEVVMSIFMHYWDSRSRKADREGSSFSSDHYAASTADLHGLLRSSIAVVRNEQLSYTHFDVFSALDERDGPVILEVDSGRNNSYVAIMIFLLNIFKCTRGGATNPAVQRMPSIESRSVLKAICKGRYTQRSAHDDSALEEYLDGFVE